MGIKYKILLSILLIMAFPLLGTLFFTYQEIQNQFKQELLVSQHKVTNQLNKSLQVALDDLDNKMMSIYVMKDLYEYATNYAGRSSESLEDYIRMDNVLKVLTLSLGGNSNVYFFLDYDRSLHTVDYKNLTLQVTHAADDGQAEWLRSIRRGEGESVIYSQGTASGGAPIFIGRSITDVIRNKYVGVLAIDLNRQFFAESLGKENLGDRIRILDARGHVLFATKEADGGGDGDMILVRSDANEYGWVIEKYIPASFFRQVAWNSIQVTFYMGAAVVLIIGIVLWLFYEKQISEPIVGLVRSMKKVGTGNFKVNQDGKLKNRKDEIGLLAKQFDSMVSMLDEMIQSQYELKLRESNSRVKALQAQINPHFLYNTLTSLYSEALEIGSESICSMIKSLSSMFRYTTGSDTDIVPLGKEIEHVRNYLQIQKYRFESAFNYAIDIPEPLLSHPCVKLSLQPIVENALIHGIARKGRGELSIEGGLEDGQLQIVVSDSGEGILPERLEHIEERLRMGDRTEEHIGMTNVHQRILYYFAGSDGIRVESRPGRGTTVTIKWRVPAHDQSFHY